MLKVKGQDFVAAATFGLGAIGKKEPRAAHSFLPEFEAEIAQKGRLSVSDFAKYMGEFFHKHWKDAGHSEPNEALHFFVGGYDQGAPYGSVFLVSIPDAVTPVEQNANDFGIAWGGQREITDRILNGLSIPYQFLPLQDCVDFVTLLIRTTAELMRYTTDLRGVGGPIDVITITPTRGLQDVQVKQIRGERQTSE